jgi:quercetin dioxygenase-like cupin family protein
MKKYFPFLVALFVSIFVGVIVSQSLVAGQKKEKPAIKRNILFKKSNLKGKEIIISLVEIAPKIKVPKHYHPAYLFVHGLNDSRSI